MKAFANQYLSSFEREDRRKMEDMSALKTSILRISFLMTSGIHSGVYNMFQIRNSNAINTALSIYSQRMRRSSFALVAATYRYCMMTLSRSASSTADQMRGRPRRSGGKDSAD